MPVAIYPTPPNPAHVGETTGPQYLRLLDQAPEWFGSIMHEFKDGGTTRGLTSTNHIQRWEIFYDGLTEAQAAILDAHYLSAQGSFGGFSFRHPRTDVLHNDCHYQSFEPDHTVRWSNSRRIVIEKRPIP